MLYESLLSFASPTSKQITIGTVSFSIHIEYIAKMKFFFSKASVYPNSVDHEMVSKALEMAEKLLAKEKVEQYNGEDSWLSYFYETFISPSGKCNSHEEQTFLLSALQDLLRDIEEWLVQNEEKAKRKNEAIEAELEKIVPEEIKLREQIHGYMLSGAREVSREEEQYFLDAGKWLQCAYNEWIYRLILDDEIADFYFLHNLNGTSLKAKFIIQCIEHEDKKRATELINRIIKTSDYPDFAPKNDNMWEHSAFNTMRSILNEYLPNKVRYLKNYSDDIRYFVVEITELLISCLKWDSREDLLGYLSLVDPDRKYAEKYIETLLFDVEHYASIPRPRGWAGPKVVNRISNKIVQSFAFLEELGRVDVIIAILEKMKNAGSSLKPINYFRWVEICRGEVTKEAFEIVKKGIKW